MARGKQWTAEDERVIADQIKRNANNICRGLKNSARILGRSFPACKHHWYTVMLKRENAAVCLATIGYRTKNVNRKVVSEYTSDNTETVKVSWWRKFLTLLKRNA